MPNWRYLWMPWCCIRKITHEEEVSRKNVILGGARCGNCQSRLSRKYAEFYRARHVIDSMWGRYDGSSRGLSVGVVLNGGSTLWFEVFYYSKKPYALLYLPLQVLDSHTSSEYTWPRSGFVSLLVAQEICLFQRLAALSKNI